MCPRISESTLSLAVTGSVTAHISGKVYGDHCSDHHVVILQQIQDGDTMCLFWTSELTHVRTDLGSDKNYTKLTPISPS